MRWICQFQKDAHTKLKLFWQNSRWPTIRIPFLAACASSFFFKFFFPPHLMQRVMEPQNLDGAIRRNQLEWDKKSDAHFDEEIKQMFDSYSLTYLAFPARNQSDCKYNIWAVPRLLEMQHKIHQVYVNEWTMEIVGIRYIFRAQWFLVRYSIYLSTSTFDQSMWIEKQTNINDVRLPCRRDLITRAIEITTSFRNIINIFLISFNFFLLI